MPEVSIIIPNFNHAPFLKKRIDSVLKQTFKDYELIILDDFSSDNSIEIIEQFREIPQISYIEYNKKNSGSTFKQWQKGINQAKGKYIWIAESDDACDPNFLQELVTLHHKYDLGIAYSKSLPIDKNDCVYDYSDWWMKRIDPKKWESDYFNEGKNECENYLAAQCTIPNASAVLFKADALNKINIDNITFKVCGDWFIYARILKDYDIAYTIKTINYHRNHNQNARNLYQSSVLIEQFTVMNYIATNFQIKKRDIYWKSLNEKIEAFISAIKNTKLTNQEILTILKYLYRLDKLFIFRLVKLTAGKIFGTNVSFR